MADTEQREDIAVSADTAERTPSETGRGAPEPAGGDEFDHVLGEFDAATKPANGYFSEPSPGNVDALLDDGPADIARGINEFETLRRDGVVAGQRAAQLEQAVHQMRQREFDRVEREDLLAYFKQGQDHISDLPVPPDFAQRWLIAEAMMDDKLAAYWDARKNPALDPHSRRVISGYLKDTLHKLRQAAQAVPDPELTADRHAVVAAMRGAHGARFDPTPAAPSFTHASDRELNKYTLENFGFRAI